MRMTDTDSLKALLAGANYDRPRKMSYIALDVPDWNQALQLVETFGSAVDGYKIGLELFHRAGPKAVETLCEMKKRVFLDIKLHDIPNTVAGALKAVCELPIEMVNVHALGGRKMLEAARQTVSDGTYSPLLIAVTILTSLQEADLSEVGLAATVGTEVERLVQLAQAAGLDGVVASALETQMIRRKTGSDFEVVVPGTRPKGASQHDQKRTLTPGEAVLHGASRLVLGRAVTQAEQPLAALGRIWDEINMSVSQLSEVNTNGGLS